MLRSSQRCNSHRSKRPSQTLLWKEGSVKGEVLVKTEVSMERDISMGKEVLVKTEASLESQSVCLSTVAAYA